MPFVGPKALLLNMVLVLAALMLMAGNPLPASGSSSLTHEVIINATWDDSIKPLLLKRYPSAREENLREAYAYACGGSMLQDIGLYPIAGEFFSSLAHFTRSGDFVEALIRESNDINEYAFALGAMTHHLADSLAHPQGINRAVPIAYPKLRDKYGDEVLVYGHLGEHLRVEFGFDVLMMVRGLYTPRPYAGYEGFKIHKPVLDRAFKNTYGISFDDAFEYFDFGVGLHRRVLTILARDATRQACKIIEKEARKNSMKGKSCSCRVTAPLIAERSKSPEYERGLITWLGEQVFHLTPKVWRLRGITIKSPPAGTEGLLIDSYDLTIQRCREGFAKIKSGEGIELANVDLETGRIPKAGEYHPADNAFSRLLRKHARNGFVEMSDDLKAVISDYYAGADEDRLSRQKHSKELITALAALSNKQQGPAAVAGP